MTRECSLKQNHEILGDKSEAGAEKVQRTQGVGFCIRPTACDFQREQVCMKSTE